METLECVSGLHNGLEFSQPSSCLDKAMQLRKKCSILLNECLEKSQKQLLSLINSSTYVNATTDD